MQGLESDAPSDSSYRLSAEATNIWSQDMTLVSAVSEPMMVDWAMTESG
jgi:hypothetical protein